ncbi:rhodanese-like domain-containing protein [Bacillus luteolus]|uniref:Rhodanese-like domain-containing protein n=1 Tax=Litchfieldia luteola TaxID=682179 RepID=A0ABR9QGZ8_9BACI|nr:rhodanese-like domain-containing protein [Cytobacillus luteolus]MBE4907514.1 rhodanese-like domain-containing protein [Cytobacillus luteolus]MBP1944283.1 rhodanese-related sulfurtransferase [Cytobacillus luteolus]
MSKKLLVIIPIVLVLVFMGMNMTNSKGITSITTEELAEKLDSSTENVVFVDVREVDEFQEGHVEGMINVPLSTLKENYNQIPIDSEIVLFCRSGNRSMQAAQILQDLGYKKIINVEGGIMSWTGPTVN